MASVFGVMLIVFALRHKSIFYSYDEFDQKGSGWRAIYDERGDCQEGARLIEDYIRYNHLWLAPNQLAALHFHAAQMFLFAGMNSQAMPHLNQATNSFMGEDWNDDVVATRAFVLKDRAQLEAARERLVAGHASDDTIQEADKFIERFGESYANLRWWAPLSAVVSIPTNASPEHHAAAEKLARAFGLSVVTAESKPAHCVWLELHTWDSSTGHWKGYNYWDGFMILHYDNGTVISASSQQWLDSAVERFIKSSRERNGGREAPTGLMTSFRLAR